MEEGGPCRLGLWGGPPALQALEGVPPEAVEPLLTGESQYRPGAPGLWVLPLARAGRTYLFGGGHVGAELCPLLARTGFRPVVCDDRPGFARRERFPQAEEVLLVDYRDLSPLPLTEQDRAVVLTAGHQGDFEVLRQVLAAPVCYVGCIGSRRKAALLRERLAALGFSPARLDQIWSPIGLPIGGDTPAEIAVSIAAQLIAHRAGAEISD